MSCIHPMKPWSAVMDRWSTLLRSASIADPLGMAVKDSDPRRPMTAWRWLIAWFIRLIPVERTIVHRPTALVALSTVFRADALCWISGVICVTSACSEPVPGDALGVAGPLGVAEPLGVAGLCRAVIVTVVGAASGTCAWARCV